MYPIAMLGLLVLTSLTVLLVIQNTLEILIGLKALPLSTRVSSLVCYKERSLVSNLVSLFVSAIHPGNIVAVQAGCFGCRPRGTFNPLLVRCLCGRFLHNALHEECPAEKETHITVAVDLELRPSVDTQLRTAATLQDHW